MSANETLPNDLTLAYLDSLIATGILENLHLDYKDVPSLEINEKNKAEISKDVSAFANSDGGRIVYGMAEKGHLPIKYSGVKDVGKTREWLNQIIQLVIEPGIEGARIFPILLNDGTAVFIVDIPPSFTAHQANDRKYYRRTEYSCEPMHDYEVKQTINRGREPILVLDNSLKEGYLFGYDNMVLLKLTLKNVGKKTAKSLEVFLHFPQSLISSTQHSWNKIEQDSSRYKGYSKFHLAPYNSGYSEIHPGAELLISQQGLDLGIYIRNLGSAMSPQTFKGYYEIFAEDMTPATGEILFEYGRTNVTVKIVKTNAV